LDDKELTASSAWIRHLIASSGLLADAVVD